VVQWKKRIEIATNLAILCAFLAVASLAAKRFFEHPAAANASGPQVGASISLPGVDWNKSLESPLMSVRASGTPTLIMLNRRGRIQKAWVGKLNAEGQAEVLSSLQP
jgi:hypothetical protein